jgi:hypothetical protein
MRRFASCLGSTNAEEYHRYMQALGGGQQLKLDCSLTDSEGCNAQAAADSSSISFSTASLATMAEDTLCSAMFHEMMHWFGTPDAGDLHGDGVDRVYACGRYCGGSSGCMYVPSGLRSEDTCSQTPPACR